ncbi:MAG: winged-helix domain-containing protein [Alphaproteobacteria bacterium]|nr:winged-helix domain-containing protein [Alphaproteobacteria bacterium]
MIGIIAKNNLTRQVLCDALAEFEPEIYETGEKAYDLIVLYQTAEFADGFFKSLVPCPVLLVGSTHEEADYCLPTPCRLSVLKQTVVRALENAKNAPIFENPIFLFNAKKREVLHKQTEAVFHLTEKENALVSYLACHVGQPCSKDELLTQVWNYNPEAQTHTVESHVYALKQKIGLDNNYFIDSDEDGYFLVTQQPDF